MTATQPYRGSYVLPAFEHASVVDVMRPGAMTCAPDAPLIQVAQTMATNHVHCVVVGGMTRDLVLGRIHRKCAAQRRVQPPQVRIDGGVSHVGCRCPEVLE